MTVNIAGKEYVHLVTNIERKAKIVYSSNNGEAVSGKAILDPLYTKIFYRVEIDSMYKDQNALEELWEDIIKPRRFGFWFEAPYNQGTLRFQGYIDGDITQVLHHVAGGKNIWDKISFDIYPIDPQVMEVET